MSRREIVAARIQKFGGTQIIVSVKRADDGAPLLDIREHFEKDGMWHPTRAGITLGMSKARLISDAIERAIQIAETKHASAS